MYASSWSAKGTVHAGDLSLQQNKQYYRKELLGKKQNPRRIEGSGARIYEKLVVFSITYLYQSFKLFPP